MWNWFQRATTACPGQKSLADHHKFDCLIILTNGYYYLGSRYLDMYHIIGWKYYFPDLEGDWMTLQYPSKNYLIDLGESLDDCDVEKYNQITSDQDQNNMIQQKFLDVNQDLGPIIFVKKNGPWTQHEINKILI